MFIEKVLNIRQTDFKTGAHHSTPHRGGGRPDPTSVIASTYVGGPETPGSGLEHASSSSSASPHQDSYDVQLRQQQQQQHDYRRMRQSSSMTWVETPPHTLPTTTFGTDPQIRHVGEDAFNAYNELSISTDPDPHSVRHSDGINWDDHLANKSSMSNNSGNWSSAGTTTTATSGNNLPTIFAQNGSNKIAVPPQQQRKSSQMRQSTSNQSNFRYSDTPVSRQNMVFQSAASVASPESISQNLIMKEMYIGKLEAQVRSLASQSEQQQIEFDSERQKSRRDAAFYAKCRHRLSVANETIEKLQDERNEEVQRHAADVQTLKDTIRQRDDRIAELLSKMTTSMGVDDVRKFKEEIGELQTKISALKKALEAKDRRISMLEESEGALRRELAEAKAECKSNSSGDERGRSNVLILPHSFDSILKNHYKKIQICSDIASRIVDSSQLMATGEKRKALQTLGWITDTEAEESEAIVSTAPDAPSKMTLVAAERYVRRECEMLDKLKDKLQGVVELYVDLCKKTDISQQQQNGQGSASSTRSKHHNRV